MGETLVTRRLMEQLKAGRNATASLDNIGRGLWVNTRPTGKVGSCTEERYAGWVPLFPCRQAFCCQDVRQHTSHQQVVVSAQQP